MEIKEIKKLEKNLPKFICDVCHFKCYQKSDWNRHLMRAKHLASVNGNVQEILETKKLEKTAKDLILVNVVKRLRPILVYGNTINFVKTNSLHILF